MGTRGLVGYYSKGITKATYNHFDSYPSCLGEDVREYIADRTAEELYDDFLGIRLINDDDEVTPEDVVRYADVWYGNVGKAFINGDLRMEQGWYDLLRSDQGDLEAYAEIGLMIDSASFIKDSLFCEWAYIINLDRGVLEVYRGFQTKKPKKNRYALSKEEIDELKADLKKRGKGYWMNEVDFRTGKVKKKIFHRNHAFYNCDLIAQIPLEIVPSFDMELFEKIVRDAEDEADVRGGNVIQVNKFGTEMIRSKVLLNVLCLNGYCEKPEVNDMYEPYFWKPQSNYDMTPSVIRNDVYLSEVFA